MSRVFAAGTNKVQFDDPNVGAANNITVCAWIYRTGLGVDGSAILSYGDQSGPRGWMLSVNSAQSFEVRIAGGAAQTHGTSISTNTWFHVAARLPQNGANVDLQVYVNGVIGSGNFGNTHTAPNSTDDILIGAPYPNDSSGRANWTGRIAECFIWNANLNDDEIQGAMLGRGWSIRPSSLVFYAPLWGLQSPEPNLAKAGDMTGTVTGATAGAHAPVTLFTPRWAATMVEAGAGGGGGGGQPAHVRSLYIPGMRRNVAGGIFG